jgi:uncharacterized protein (DUF1697 family)
MPIYVAMLRGINVGGHKKIKMEQLRASLDAMGLQQVKTYIQSGNVVFKTAKISSDSIRRKIEKAILEDFGHSVSVITRTAETLKSVIEKNPFLKQRGIDHDKLHLMFLSETPAASAIKQLEALVAAPDQLHCHGEEVYFYLPNGVADSILMKKPLERLLNAKITTRNWRTVNALHQMCQGCE